MKKIMIALTMFFVLIINVNAAVCSEEEKNNLMVQANAVNHSVDLSEYNSIEHEDYYEEGYISFIISFFNMNKDLKINQVGTSQTTNENHIQDGRVSIRVYDHGPVTLSFNILGATENCNGEKLRTLEVSVPMYNELSRNPICKEIPDYEYCSKTFPTNTYISHDDFISGAKAYQEDQGKAKKDDDAKANLLPEMLKYGVIIGLAIIVIAIVIITIRKIKRDRDIKKRGIV